MRYPRRSLRCPARRICGTCGRHGSAVKNVASSNGHVDTLPQTSVILGCSSRSKRERIYVVASAISFGDAIASVGVGSNYANGSHKSSCEASSSHWPAQRSTSAQSCGRGHTLPPYPPDGGVSCDGSSLPPPSRPWLYRWYVFSGRYCPSISCSWNEPSTTNAPSTQAVSSSSLPPSRPTCSQPSGASSKWAW
jgi:hypothetical protein